MSDRRQALEAQLLADPFNAGLRRDYAGELLDSGEAQSALDQFELALRTESGNGAAEVGAAKALMRLGRELEAMNRYERARRAAGFSPDPDLEKLRPAVQSNPVRLTIAGGTQSKATVVPIQPEAAEKTRFSHIAGMEDLKRSIRLQIVEPFLNPGVFAKFRKRSGGGFLLYGPPGCGKTLLARAVANECNATFLSVGISDILTSWLGESERNLVLMFEKARSEKPSVIFFDELDALAFSRSKASSDTSRKMVNEFLAQLDGFEQNNQDVLILAATNMPWDIDPAMKRPGRFARQVFIPPPDADARATIIESKLENVPHEPIDASRIAAITPLYSGADIDALVERAKDFVLAEFVETRREREISMEDLLRAAADMTPSTREWLRTARNLVKYGGEDDSYRDLQRYLKANKLL